MGVQRVEAGELDEAFRTMEKDKQKLQDAPEKSSSNEDAATTETVYPPLFARCIIVFGLMLATFLVCSTPSSFISGDSGNR